MAALGRASQPMVCFGNEPSWSLQFNEPGKARFATPDQPGVDYVGNETRLDPLTNRCGAASRRPDRAAISLCS